MRTHSAVALALSVPLLAAAATAAGAELTVFVTGSMADPLEHATHDFIRDTGHTLRFERATTGGLLAKIRAGERGDVIVIAADAAATLEQDGTLVAGTRTPIASSLFGVVVRAGAPSPDVATPEAFKETVLRAPTISYPDPVAATVSGGYIESVFAELGIKDAARGKAQLKPMGYLVGQAVVDGDAELGLSFMSEFVANPSLEVVPFPRALQKPQLYTAGVFAGSANAAVARELIAFLTTSAASEKLSAAGVVPAGAQ
ncbi:MAG TPA: substrate-binding domain-containing protein [Gammaproteobacteria bacterium]|nr:substrate-binding domain-containing protein [Gammaproteobacteria bacterium]